MSHSGIERRWQATQPIFATLVNLFVPHSEHDPFLLMLCDQKMRSNLQSTYLNIAMFLACDLRCLITCDLLSQISDMTKPFTFNGHQELFTHSFLSLVFMSNVLLVLCKFEVVYCTYIVLFIKEFQQSVCTDILFCFTWFIILFYLPPSVLSNGEKWVWPPPTQWHLKPYFSKTFWKYLCFLC